jgi:DNA-binding NtrC family response regulator
LPPLRARREDIPRIAHELLVRRGFEPGAVSGDSLELLLTHAWPGNVRELRNVIERGIALSPGVDAFSSLRLSLSPLATDDGELSVRADLPYADAKANVLEVFERRYLRDLLTRTKGNISEASRQSGLDRKHLRTLLRRHHLID